MAIIVVGGHSRSIGKTSVVAGIISALRECDWTAVKITQYGHAVCSANGRACDCATDDHSLAVSEETDRSGESDTSRFLVAGATRAFWIRTQQGRLAEAMPRIRRIISGPDNIIFESNSILKFLRPDIYLTVLDPQTLDFKDSAREFLDLADGLILHNIPQKGTVWRDVSLKPVLGRPMFYIQPPPYVTPEIVEFVRSHMTGGFA